MIFAIDPGNEQSAWCIMNNNYELLGFDKQPNRKVMEEMLSRIDKEDPEIPFCSLYDAVVIERMMSYSANVGKTTFETCEWIGRFSQEAEKIVPVRYLNRKDEKMYLCGTMNANDTTIRHALIDRFAKFDFKRGTGVKKNPDYFYGVHHDIWSAICIAVTYLDMQREKKNET